MSTGTIRGSNIVECLVGMYAKKWFDLVPRMLFCLYYYFLETLVFGSNLTIPRTHFLYS